MSASGDILCCSFVKRENEKFLTSVNALTIKGPALKGIRQKDKKEARDQVFRFSGIWWKR
jgi:hypothetical protein